MPGLRRFLGTVEKLCDLDVTGLIDWADAIPLSEWPTVAGSMRGPEWRDAGSAVEPYAQKLLTEHFPQMSASQHYFSMILPGQRIAAHRDEQPPSWLCRIHVPILTNSSAMIVLADEQFHLKAGEAYKINTLLPHSVRNGGPTPRLHWMFDVLSEEYLP